MEYWEFLLQKQGERTWQKIYKPSLEIEEGKYRVVSHSSRNNSDVEIRVTHLDTEAAPPKRRISKRSRRTNSQGLMVVIPYTYLKPGVWEFRCCGDIMSDLLGENWQEIVKLNISAKTNQESLSLPPTIVENAPTEAKKAETEEVENPANIPIYSHSDPSIELSEAPEIDPEELSLFAPKVIDYSPEDNSPSLTDIEGENTFTEAETLLTNSPEEEEESFRNDSPELNPQTSAPNSQFASDETSADLSTNYSNPSSQKAESSPGEISISSPSGEEKRLNSNSRKIDFFWEESNSNDSEIINSEIDSTEELSWLNDFEEMRTNDIENSPPENNNNPEADLEIESNESNYFELSNLNEIDSELEATTTSQSDLNDGNETSAENELSWLSEIESNDISERNSELEISTTFQPDLTNKIESNDVIESDSELETISASQSDLTDEIDPNDVNEISQENELSWLSEIESNNLSEANSEIEIIPTSQPDLTNEIKSNDGNETSAENELSWLNEIESSNVSESDSELETIPASQPDLTEETESNELNKISAENELNWLSEIESNDVSESDSELEISTASQLNFTDEIELNDVYESDSELKISTASQPKLTEEIELNDVGESSAQNELNWLREIESNDVSESDSELEISTVSQLNFTDEIESNDVYESDSELKISTVSQLNFADEIESNDVYESNSELEITPESQQNLTEKVELNPLSEDNSEFTQISSEDESAGISDVDLNNNESNAIAENIAHTETNLLDEEKDNYELSEAKIIGEETKQNDATTTANSLIEKSVQDLEQILQQTVEPLLAEMQETPNDNWETTKNTEQISETENNLELQLSLTEEVVVRNNLGNLAIAGNIETVAEKAEIPNANFTGKLIYQVRDPQSNNILAEKEQALVNKNLPLSFGDRLEIPSECQTRLLLGEVILQSDSGMILATQNFTVTADIQELLQIFNEENSDRAENQMQLIGSSLTNKKNTVALREDFLKLAKKSEQVQSTKRSSGQIIPPKIGRLEREEKTFKSLRLPSFGKPLALKPNSDPDNENSVVLNLQQLQDSVDQTISATNGNGNKNGSQKIASSTAIENSSEKSLEMSLTKQPKDSRKNKQEIADPEPKTEFNSINNQPTETEKLPSQTSSENRAILDTNQQQNELDEEDIFDFSSETDIENEAEFSEIIAAEEEISGDEPFNENIFAADFSDFPAEEISHETSSENLADEDNDDLWFSDETRNVEADFKALKMQERFFSRLNLLATDIEGKEQLPNNSLEENNLPEAEITTSTETELDNFTVDSENHLPDTEIEENPNLDSQEIEAENINLTEETPELASAKIEPENSSEAAATDLIIDETTEEIVIETEDEANFRNQTTPVDTSGLPYPAEVTQLTSKSIVFSQPQWKAEIPTPQLSISEKELIPGESMRVRVKLSSYPGSVYVKLWIKDRQTRTLLDGPHGLVDLIPNRFGELETIAQMKVPLGSMEISIEAIAISPETQRESHKAIFNHAVLPPDELDLDFDNF
ncbi:MAG: hypothetical protein SAJ37_03085 [Oscillatoria sp. PMC 1068.18]|nr:hypothetical protein [Oscillatoria sp. PMC 1076.18]MEC4987709.1 hypothetical protein [Oscillatoria sp. PMC 1068.18]